MTSTTTGVRPAGGAARGRDAITVSGAVSAALAAGRPVVALESTIFSRLGLPAPANGDALRRCLAAVRAGGAEPAVTAILDGKARVGLEPGEEERVLAGSRKVAERDIAVAAAQGLEVGVTTVSASVALAHAAGIQVFATGGIGGVHRGAELTGDISADLDALASHPVVTVCAGAKAFLDLARTLEYLETAGVPVLGWQHDWFPAFYLRSSGLPVPHRVETARVVADVLRGRTREYTGVLLTVPIPPADALAPGPLNAALDAALAACEAARITGAAVTPFVLERIERQTAGASVPANLALAENNARVAALVAAALTVALPGMPVLAGDARVPGNDRFVERPAVADQERRVRQDEPGLPPGDRGLKRHARVFGLDRVAGGEAGVRPRPHLLGGHPERDRPHGVAHAQPFARPADGGRRGDVVLERPVDLDRGEERPVAQVV
jgi:pseudouridylate synthase